MLSSMLKFTAIALIFGLLQLISAAVQKDYFVDRSNLLQNEELMMLGGDVKLEGKEVHANEVLMEAKNKELNDGFNAEKNFLPGQSFLGVVDRVRESKVFKILEKMPKGTILHVLDTGITSSDYIFKNITFRSNLYVCEVNGLLRLQFVTKPNMTECSWRLLADVRKTNQAQTINERIFKQLTMVTDNPALAYPNIDSIWVKGAAVVATVRSLVLCKPVFEDYFYQGLLEAYNDNVLYVEVRTDFSALYDLDGTVYNNPLQIAQIFKNVADRFVKDHPDFIGAKLIYAARRNATRAQVDQYIVTMRQLKQLLPEFVIGFDLTGREDKGEPLIKFADQLKALGKDVDFYFHVGETNWYGTSVDTNLVDALLLNTKRIAHGNALIKHPKLLEIVRERNIPIEIQPIANQISLITDLRNHPANLFFAQNFAIVVANNNPELWGAKGLSYDFYEAFMGMMSAKADLRALKKLALNSIIYSAMNKSERSRALSIWNQNWKKFVENLSG